MVNQGNGASYFGSLEASSRRQTSQGRRGEIANWEWETTQGIAGEVTYQKRETPQRRRGEKSSGIRRTLIIRIDQAIRRRIEANRGNSSQARRGKAPYRSRDQRDRRAAQIDRARTGQDGIREETTHVTRVEGSRGRVEEGAAEKARRDWSPGETREGKSRGGDAS